MQPRLVFRTHYQVDEPAYLRLLIHCCSSPVQSAYDEAVADKLAREARRRGKDFNVPAAGYVLDLAHALDVITTQNVWTPTGHLVGLLSAPREVPWDEQLALDERERLIYLRVFLEGDGAALLFLARHVTEHGSIPNSEGDWNSLAQRMFVDTYQEYLKLTATTADRVGLRSQLDRIQHKGYTGKSGSHKLFVHLQAMYRLGLLDRLTNTGRRRYSRLGSGNFDPLARLIQAVPSIYALEQVAREGHWVDIAGGILGWRPVNDAPRAPRLWALLVSFYRGVMGTGVPLCPLRTVIEALQIEWATAQEGLISYATVLEAIERSQLEHVRDIRFHVDRRGRPAFIKLSDDFVARHLAPATSG
jgi:hypothetical protein